MNSIITAILIVGASVSSGFSGKPSGEYLAERLGVSYVNQAYIAHRVDAAEINPAPGTLIMNLDGNYWRSYDKDCVRAAQAVRDFYIAAADAPKIMGTVPARNAGWFYRLVASAEQSEQVCRSEVNAAIADGCKDNCILLDADELYSEHKDVADIHLTPEIWRTVAERIYNEIEKQKEPPA